MATSVGWFISLAALAGLGLSCGLWLGRGPRSRAGLGLALGLALLLLWAWLLRHPSVAVNAIPVPVLSYIEGTGAVPVFMLVAGIAAARARLRRQRTVTALAMVCGALFFLNGGLWMLKTTPAHSLATTVSRGVVLQSQEYSCVPAACATALNQLGIRTSEAEMAQLTQTRAGSGATLIRALDGLKRRLALLPAAPWRVELVEPTPDQLAIVPTPALAVLRLEARRGHMVVLQRIDDQGVWITDPLGGLTYLPREEFLGTFTGQVLVFRK